MIQKLFDFKWYILHRTYLLRWSIEWNIRLRPRCSVCGSPNLPRRKEGGNICISCAIISKWHHIDATDYSV